MATWRENVIKILRIDLVTGCCELERHHPVCNSSKGLMDTMDVV